MPASDDTHPHSDTSSTLHGHEGKFPVQTFQSPPHYLSQNVEKLASSQPFEGLGSLDNPFIVDWYTDDKANPYNWSKPRKWLITMQVSFLFVTMQPPLRTN